MVACSDPRLPLWHYCLDPLQLVPVTRIACHKMQPVKHLEFPAALHRKKNGSVMFENISTLQIYYVPFIQRFSRDKRVDRSLKVSLLILRLCRELKQYSLLLVLLSPILQGLCLVQCTKLLINEASRSLKDNSYPGQLHSYSPCIIDITATTFIHFCTSNMCTRIVCFSISLRSFEYAYFVLIHKISRKFSVFEILYPSNKHTWQGKKSYAPLPIPFSRFKHCQRQNIIHMSAIIY